jgi:fatty acid desaturase
MFREGEVMEIASEHLASATIHFRLLGRRFRSVEGLYVVGRWLMLGIVLAGGCSLLLPAPWLRIPLLTLIAGYLQRRATSGAVHEATHGALFVSRAVNDAVGRVAAALCFIDYDTARGEHLLHHRYLGTDGDPELRARRKMGLDPDHGMQRNRILRTLAAPFAPSSVSRQIVSAARALRSPTALVVWTVAAPTLVFTHRRDLLIAWLVAPVTIHPFLWLLANSTEHDFALARDTAEAAMTEASRRAAQPRSLQWLACSRERRGLIFVFCCPESEKRNHGDHHSDPALPGAYLQAAVDLKMREVPGMDRLARRSTASSATGWGPRQHTRP